VTTSHVYSLPLTGFVEITTSPTYQFEITNFTEITTSPTYQLEVDAFLDKGTSHVYQLTLVAPSYKVRSAQFADGTIEEDRFQNALGHTISTTSNVDLTSTGQTLLYTVPANQKIIVTGAILVATSGTATGDADAQVGSNSTANNIFANATLVQFRDAQDVWAFWSQDIISAVTREQTINLEITTPATGTLVADIHLIGFIL